MKLLDFISSAMLQQIQDLFSDATGLAAIAVDEEGNYITKASNFTDFCMKYTRGSLLGKQRCEKCDAECTGTYFCHAGLMDFSEEILVNGIKLGAIIGGQVLPGPPDQEKFLKIAEELSISPGEYIAALNKVPVKDEKSIRASAKLLGQVINAMVNLNYLQKNSSNALEVLETEISQSVAGAEAIKQYADKLEGIAGKQNILSLNASIEAARTGLAGAGFAVVAGQMGQLAKDSTVIYDNIKQNANAVYQSMMKISNTTLK